MRRQNAAPVAAAAAAADDINKEESDSKPREQHQLRSINGKGSGGDGAGGDRVSGLVFMALLAIQFGIHPLLVKAYISPAVNKTSTVLATELCKAAIASVVLMFGGGGEGGGGFTSTPTLDLPSSARRAAVPASIYAVQNWLSALAYQHLPGVTYNLLNQTKIMATAMFVWMMLGKKQSRQQLVALALLMVAAALLSSSPPSSSPSSSSSSSTTTSSSTFWLGVVPVLVASATSGLASAICQHTLQQGGGCNSYLFTLEMSVYSSIMLGSSLLLSRDGHLMRKQGFFAAWTPQTALPVVNNALGGIFVGQVTKHVGSVGKGFAVIVSLVITALLQGLLGLGGAAAAGSSGPVEVWLAMPLVAISVWMHSAYPWRPPDHTSSSALAKKRTHSA